MGGNSGSRIVGAAWVGGALVPESAVIQRVRREEGLGADHLQCSLRFLVQPSSARSLRDHPSSFSRGQMDQLEARLVLFDSLTRLLVALLPLLLDAT